jgi:hypothetical protein
VNSIKAHKVVPTKAYSIVEAAFGMTSYLFLVLDERGIDGRLNHI